MGLANTKKKPWRDPELPPVPVKPEPTLMWICRDCTKRVLSHLTYCPRCGTVSHHREARRA